MGIGPSEGETFLAIEREGRDGPPFALARIGQRIALKWTRQLSNGCFDPLVGVGQRRRARPAAPVCVGKPSGTGPISGSTRHHPLGRRDLARAERQ